MGTRETAFPVVVLLSVALCIGCSDADQREPPAGDTFLGLQTPGTDPVEFAPAILSGMSLPHSRLIIAPDSISLYWNGNPAMGVGAVLFYSRFDGTTLTRPEQFELTPPFYSGKLEFSEDGGAVFYSGTGPGPGQEGLWYVERRESGWSEPMPIVLNEDNEWASLGQPSLSRSWNLFYAARKTSDTGPGLYWSRFVDGTWMAPERLPLEISAGAAADPYIDPEERYLLFTAFRRSDSNGPTDLFVSFRNGDGSWGEPLNLSGAIATPYFERFPSVSPDGRFLFFVMTTAQTFPGEDTAFYWVSAEVLEILGTPGSGQEVITPN